MTVNPNLPVSLLVNVGVVLSPAGAQSPNLSTMLMLGSSAVIDVVSRMRTYASLLAVANDFGTSAPEYLAAQAWFGQSPQPTTLNIGRWAQAASAGQLFCGSLSAANTLLSAWTAINNGELRLAVNGVGPTSTGVINFGAATSLNNVAALIQTAIQAIGGGFAAVTCVYDSIYNRFIITSGTTGSSSSISFLTAPGAGTDITAMMSGLVASAGAYVANGIGAESALAAVTLFDTQFSGQWYGLHILGAIDTDHTAVASYIEGAVTPHFYWINTQESQVLAAGDTTHIGYLLQQLNVSHTAWIYSSSSLYAVDSLAARILTTNWSGNSTAISLMYKQLPLIAPENLNTTQLAALQGYNGNVYTNYANGQAIVETGICPSGQWIDLVVGIDALRAAMQTNIFNALFTTPTKIPQTDAGMNVLATVMEAACRQFVNNGLLAPGVWNTAGFGTLAQGAWLDKGFYVYAPPISSQNTADRNARKSVQFQVAVKSAGAVNVVFESIVVNQ